MVHGEFKRSKKMKTKTNDEIDEMIKDYITDDTLSIGDIYVSDANMMSSNPSDYSDLISIDVDTIDLSNIATSTITISDPYENQDVTMEIDGKQRSMRELFSTVDAISRRLAVLEPKKHLLDKYEVLQDLYEQYKAAEALLYEDEEEEFPF